MTMYHLNPNVRDSYTLPCLEVFFMTGKDLEEFADEEIWQDGSGNVLGEGWFYWICQPGCLPDSDPSGPFETEKAALRAAREEYLD